MNLKKIVFFTIVTLIISHKSTAQNFDIDLLKTINSSNNNSLVWRSFTSSAYPVSAGIPIIIGVAGELDHNKPALYNALQITGGLLTAAVLTEGLKITINRERPYQKYPTLIYAYDISESGESFPSAHTSVAFSTAMSLAIIYKKWYIVVPSFIWAGGVGYSRLYLGEHYPTDVFAGAVIGAGSALVSHWLTKKFLKIDK